MAITTCGKDNCNKPADQYTYPDEQTTAWLCPDHAGDEGFCCICGHFCAGIESFDFSPMKGVCHDCLTDLAEEEDTDGHYEY